jgi:hypothetical protein
MSGASRAFTSAAGSDFFARACSAPLSRMLDSERSIGTNVSVAIECIEVFTITPFPHEFTAEAES